jgi:hypothetical protein
LACALAIGILNAELARYDGINIIAVTYSVANNCEVCKIKGTANTGGT